MKVIQVFGQITPTISLLILQPESLFTFTYFLKTLLEFANELVLHDKYAPQWIQSFFNSFASTALAISAKLLQCPLDIQTSLRRQGRGCYRQRGRFIKRLAIAAWRPL